MKRHTAGLLEAEFLTAAKEPGNPDNRNKLEKIGKRLGLKTYKVVAVNECPPCSIIATHYR